MSSDIQANHPLARYVGQPVEVRFNGDRLPGRITRVIDKGDGRDIKVIFDDPLVYGGMGTGWFSASEVNLPGQDGGLSPVSRWGR